MYRFLVSFLLVLVAASNVSAFQGVQTVAAVRSQAVNSIPSTPFTASTSSTALNLKIKVDESAQDSNRINPGAFRGAAYGGSILVAVALPLVFLVWAALK